MKVFAAAGLLRSRLSHCGPPPLGSLSLPGWLKRHRVAAFRPGAAQLNFRPFTSLCYPLTARSLPLPPSRYRARSFPRPGRARGGHPSVMRSAVGPQWQDKFFFLSACALVVQIAAWPQQQPIRRAAFAGGGGPAHACANEPTENSQRLTHPLYCFQARHGASCFLTRRRVLPPCRLLTLCQKWGNPASANPR